MPTPVVEAMCAALKAKQSSHAATSEAFFALAVGLSKPPVSQKVRFFRERTLSPRPLTENDQCP